MSDSKPVRAAPEGWVLGTHRETFADRAGPFYWRKEGGPGVGFFSEPHHGNLAGVVHGGALLTLADMSLFDIAFRKLGRFKALTVALTSEFLRPGPIGEFIEASGEMTGGGKTLLFCRGMVSAAGKDVMSFSGVLKRLD